MRMRLALIERLRGSLSVKVTAAVLLSATVAAAVHILMGFWGEKERESETLRIHGSTLAKYLSSYVEDQMESHEGNDLSLLVDGIQSWEEVGTVRLLDHHGTIRVSANSDEVGRTVDIKVPGPDSPRRSSPAPHVTVLKQDNGLITIRRELPNKPTCVECHDPGAAVIGYIEISIGSGNMAMLRQPRIGWQVMSGIAILTVLCLTTVGLIRILILKRVRRLRNVVEQMEDGNLQTLTNDTSPDELGQLSQRFDLMITELTESRQRLEDSHRLELLHFDRLASIGELTSGLAHEIRNPLAAISGALQRVLKSQDQSDAQREIITEVYRQVTRLDEVVRRLLALARPDKLSLQILDANELVKRTAGVLDDLGDGVGGAGPATNEIELDLAHDLPPVRGDSKLLQQVLINLALNGLQAQAGESGKGGSRKITVSTHELHAHAASESSDMQCMDQSSPESEYLARCPHGAVSITVRDHGPGLSPEAQRMMFKPFFTTKKDGTGLGLSVAQRIVTEHEGCLFGRNAKEGGAMFAICLPAVKEEGESSNVSHDSNE